MYAYSRDSTQMRNLETPVHCNANEGDNDHIAPCRDRGQVILKAKEVLCVSSNPENK